MKKRALKSNRQPAPKPVKKVSRRKPAKPSRPAKPPPPTAAPANTEKQTADERAQKALLEMQERRSHAGRPTSYQPEFAGLVIQFMSRGYSLTAFAGEIGVSRDTVYEWEKAHAEFSDAIKRARAKRVAALEDRLLIGAGDTGATIFALKNACPDEWRKEPLMELSLHNSVKVDTGRPVEEWGEAEIRAELAKRGALPADEPPKLKPAKQ